MKPFLGCRYKMTGNNGSFTSINRNNSHAYPDFQYCSWLVSVSEGLVVSLNFTYLLMPNCQENYIDIYDGVTETSSLLVRYCGSNATTGNERIVSSRNSVYLILKSGNNSQNRDISLGFQAEYRAEVKRTGT